MVLLVLAFLASLIPSFGLFFWLRTMSDEEFKGICNKALVQGLLSVFGVVACSAAFALLQIPVKMLLGEGVLLDAYHTFFVLAFSEELMEYLFFRRVLSKNPHAYSWLEVVIVMTIVGIGFSLVEDVVYAFSTNAGQMIVRGLTAGHAGYGFIMGYFMGKGMKTGDKKWSVIGFALPWFLHGMYDFGLRDSLLAINDGFAIISVSLAVLCAVTIVVLIVFMLKARKDPHYTEPLPQL